MAARANRNSFRAIGVLETYNHSAICMILLWVNNQILGRLDKNSTQQYCCVMIPDHVIPHPACPWSVLPPGIHVATTDEIEERYATSPVRRSLFMGFIQILEMLERAGCKVVYLDGSFVSGKDIPSDFDGCWESQGVDPSLVDPVLFDFSDNRRAQKEKYGGEMFIHSEDANFLEFFQVEKYSGMQKGVLQINLPRGGSNTQ